MTVHGQCMIDSVVINALMIDPTGDDYEYDTNNDGVVNSDDEYIELCNTSSESIADISGWQIGDDDPPPYADYTIPENTLLQPGECIVLVLDYCGDGNVIDTIGCRVPDGILDMNYSGTALLGNDGDVITLSDASGEQSCSVAYGDVDCSEVDPLDIPPFNIENCTYWGTPTDGCALLADGDSCTYFPAVLSIDVSDFSVRKIELQQVQLSWWVEAAENSQQFYIEWRSELTDDYSMVGLVVTQEVDHSASNYSFIHRTPSAGINYYRLRQVSPLDEISYSQVRSVLIELGQDIDIIPTIASEHIRINGPADSYIVSIYDFNGQNYVEKIQLTNNSEFRVDHLHTGHYIVSIFDGTSTRFKRFIKI